MAYSPASFTSNPFHNTRVAFHETPQGERIAAHYHAVWCALSAASAVFAIGGVVWHALAVQAHRQAAARAGSD